jgi:ATP-binding cassette, subfamily B, bacterial
MRSYSTLLTRYLRPLGLRVAVLVALLFLSIGLQLAQPQVLRAFIDAATTNATAGYLRNAALLFIVLALVQQAAAVGATYFSEGVGWAATNTLREDLMRHTLRLDISYHKARTPGELIERIDGDVTALATFFSQFVVQIAGNVILFLGVVVVLWREDWISAFGLAVFGATAVAVMLRLRGITVPYWRRQREASAELFGYIEERLGGTEDIRSSGAENYVLYRLYPRLKQRVRTMVTARIVGVVQWVIPNLMFALWLGAGLIYVAWLYRQGALTIGTGFLIMHYVGISFRPLRVISQQMEEFQRASAGILRVRDLLAERSTLAAGDPTIALPHGSLSIDFARVSFIYDDTPPAVPPSPAPVALNRPSVALSSLPASLDSHPMILNEAKDPSRSETADLVLHDVSFSLAPGETLGLLGRTGSGKTTITRLLFRFYDPTAGSICVGGVDISRVTPAAIRDRIGLVTQDVQLFRATVRQNVALFDETIDDDRIVKAFDDLGLTSWYRALPNGLDTVLGAGGGGLSAGEAQLLAFTRVFLRDPSLVILDEASSRLDPASERLIDRAIERLLDGRTGIIIAHRLATISRVDTVLILEHGVVSEQGPRATLAADPQSRFTALLRAGLEHMDDTTPARLDLIEGRVPATVPVFPV